MKLWNDLNALDSKEERGFLFWSMRSVKKRIRLEIEKTKLLEEIS